MLEITMLQTYLSLQDTTSTWLSVTSGDYLFRAFKINKYLEIREKQEFSFIIYEQNMG